MGTSTATATPTPKSEGNEQWGQQADLRATATPKSEGNEQRQQQADLRATATTTVTRGRRGISQLSMLSLYLDPIVAIPPSSAMW
ncbi:hypothetical protein Acr_24g0008590 [Actinidia rufa]|uniref:Uncharacterized protein n=1 Tax=Actinidia rufa TaxID=165716 RepID=A0A7J0GUZ6_9ERIC|nr:hypothetical protein Acr_24g0008590 [Actinidia rufa]